MGCNQPGPEFQKAAADLPKIKSEIQAAGISLDLKDLQPKIRPEEDAYPLLESALKAETAFRKADNQFKIPHKLDDKEWLKIPEKELPALVPYLDQVIRATQRPKVDFRWDWATKNPAEILFPELFQLKLISRWLGLRAVLLAKSGKTAEALVQLRAAFAISDYVQQTPLAIHYLVGIAVEKITGSAALHAASWAGSDRQFNDRIIILLQERATLPNPNASIFKSEIAFASTTFRDPKNLFDTEDFLSEPTQPDWAKDPIMVDAYHGRILKGFFEAIKIMESGKSNLQILAELEKETERQSDPRDPVNAIRDELALDYGGMWASWMSRQTLHVLRSASIELSAMWAKTGKAPRDTTALGNRYVDPYSGQPIRFVKKGKLFVYSVGENQKDDGGAGKGGLDDMDILVPILNPNP